ncbi:hypothetical protein [Micromonospora sp. NPDC023814]|uniref:hypothetical protein n=1 Tax=Micromonospora sp. NPDC023814 TaxID=3154596 RepID=UPI0033E5D801
MAIDAVSLGDPLSVTRMVGVGLVVAGVVVLNLGGAHHGDARRNRRERAAHACRPDGSSAACA